MLFSQGQNTGAPPLHAQPHAVKQIGGNYYCYDANGNMTQRVGGGVTYQQNFNVENELTSVVVNGQTTSFTYDAAGIRVKTVKPNGVVIDHPFPNYEVENPATEAITIRRSIYTIAGQTVATRVNDNLYFFFTDHLGSTAVMATSANAPVSGSRATYLPFGNYRGAAPTQTITDRDFTGQPHNDDLGLIYMNARFFVVGIGRFASADTLVPDPTNPQQYNRYSYVLNNALSAPARSSVSRCGRRHRRATPPLPFFNPVVAFWQQPPDGFINGVSRFAMSIPVKFRHGIVLWLLGWGLVGGLWHGGTPATAAGGRPRRSRMTRGVQGVGSLLGTISWLQLAVLPARTPLSRIQLNLLLTP